MRVVWLPFLLVEAQVLPFGDLLYAVSLRPLLTALFIKLS